MNLHLKRDLTSIDWSQLADVYTQCFGPTSTSDVEKEFRGADLVCIALVDDRVVGAGHAFTDRIRDGAIYGVVVHPEFRRRGIATAMMKSILQDLKNVAVLLNTSPEAEGLYRKLGFRPVRNAMGLRYPDAEYTE